MTDQQSARAHRSTSRRCRSQTSSRTHGIIISTRKISLITSPSHYKRMDCIETL